MKYRIREEFDPKYPNTLFYYVERKILGIWWEIIMTGSLNRAHLIYDACITARYSDNCTNKIIATHTNE